MAECCSDSVRDVEPADGESPVPGNHDCGHECVIAKGAPESLQKSPREALQLLTGSYGVAAVYHASFSVPAEQIAAGDGHRPPEPRSGVALRHDLASLLL